MRKALCLALVLFTAALGMAQSVVGSWKATLPKEAPADAKLTMTFTAKGFTMNMSSGGAKFSREGTYTLKGTSLSLVPTKQTANGKTQPVSASEKAVLQLAWKGKDSFSATEIKDGKPKGEAVVFTRVK